MSATDKTEALLEWPAKYNEVPKAVFEMDELGQKNSKLFFMVPNGTLSYIALKFLTPVIIKPLNWARCLFLQCTAKTVPFGFFKTPARTVARH